MFYRMPSAQPPVENAAGPPKSELEELQIKANQVTDDVSLTQKKRNLRVFFKHKHLICSRWRVPVGCWPFARR